MVHNTVKALLYFLKSPGPGNCKLTIWWFVRVDIIRPTGINSQKLESCLANLQLAELKLLPRCYFFVCFYLATYYNLFPHNATTFLSRKKYKINLSSLDLSAYNNQYKSYQIPTIMFWNKLTDEMYKKKTCNGHLRISMHIWNTIKWQDRNVQMDT